MRNEKKTAKQHVNAYSRYGARAKQLYLEDSNRSVDTVHELLGKEGCTVSRATLYKWAKKDDWRGARAKPDVNVNELVKKLEESIGNPELSSQQVFAQTAAFDRLMALKAGDGDAPEGIPFDPGDSHLQRLEKVRDYYLARVGEQPVESLSKVRLEIVQKINAILRDHREFVERIAEEILEVIDDYASREDTELLREYVQHVEGIAKTVSNRLLKPEDGGHA